MKKRAAAFTITRNEPIWLRVWCNYYCDSFPQEDVYILDNSSSDGSVDLIKQLYPRINVISVPSKVAFDHMWLKRTVEYHQRDLLCQYDVVLFAETDEFLIPNLDQYSNIYEYCLSFRESPARPTSLRAKGWGIVHQIDTEPDVDVNSGEPLLSNRSLMWQLPDYSKTLITKVNLVYARGFHFTYDGQRREVDRPVEEDLSLMHAWNVDMRMYYQRHLDRKASGAVGFHGSSNLDQVKEFFRTLKQPWDPNRPRPLYVGNPYPVPEHWKTLLRY